jgi:hypothetical protein
MYTNLEITAGFKRANNWFSPVIVDQPFIILNDLIIKKGLLQNDLSLSEPFLNCSDLTNINCDGTFDSYMYFWNKNDNNALIWMIYLAMGNDNLNLLNAEVGQRVISLSDNIFGKFATIAFNRVLAVHELPSVKFSGFRIFGNINDILKISFNTICNNRFIDSDINRMTILRNLETIQQIEADNLIPITLKYGEFLIDEFGNSLESSDEIGISEIDFNFDRNLSPDFGTDPDHLNESIEPDIEGERNITLDIVLPYYDTLKFIENFDLQNFKHARLTFVGPTIIDSFGSTHRFTFKINFYKMKIINEDEIINNLGLVPQKLKFQLLDDGINKPFDIEIVSKDISILN